MSESRYASRFRYLDAADVVGEGVSFAGLTVLGADGTRIGGVDGFVLDQGADRATHIVVDSGGWFPSQRLLLPIGHGEVAADRKSLLANVTRNALELLPEFDAHQFGEFTDQELQAFERNTVIACCPHEPLEEVSNSAWGYESWQHYRLPAWWGMSDYAPDRLRSIASIFAATCSAERRAALAAAGEARAPRRRR